MNKIKLSESSPTESAFNGFTFGDLPFMVAGALCIMALYLVSNHIGYVFWGLHSPWSKLPFASVLFYDGGFTALIGFLAVGVFVLYRHLK